MSRKERLRLETLSRVKRNEITVTRAAELAGVSVRQMRRLWRRFAAEGDAGLVHRSRGRQPNNRLPDASREAVLTLYRARYADFGPTLACEKLKADGHDLSPDTLNRLLKEAGLWQPRRRRAKHRLRRPRRACFGQLLQMDGSEHDWFEQRAGRCVLMVAIDDANNQTLARFYPRENLDAAFDLFHRWVLAHGLPRALYVDRAAIYRADREPTGAELLDGKKPLTQFGRALDELGVELILANSPQAKGRVERRNAVFQDRLVKELRLAAISDIERANALLDAAFLAELNAKFPVEPAEPTDAHRPVEPGIRLDEVLCQQEPRVVARNWCVRWNNRWLQIARQHQALNLPGKQILAVQKRDGSLLLKHNGQTLCHTPVGQRPPPPKPPKPAVKNNKVWKPADNHPLETPGLEKHDADDPIHHGAGNSRRPRLIRPGTTPPCPASIRRQTPERGWGLGAGGRKPSCTAQRFGTGGFLRSAAQLHPHRAAVRRSRRPRRALFGRFGPCFQTPLTQTPPPLPILRRSG